MSENLSREGGAAPTGNADPSEESVTEAMSSLHQGNEPQGFVSNQGRDANDSEAQAIAVAVHQMADSTKSMDFSSDPVHTASNTNGRPSDDHVVTRNVPQQDKMKQSGPTDNVEDKLTPHERVAEITPEASASSDLTGSSSSESSSDLSTTDLPPSDISSSDVDLSEFMSVQNTASTDSFCQENHTGSQSSLGVQDDVIDTRVDEKSRAESKVKNCASNSAVLMAAENSQGKHLPTPNAKENDTKVVTVQPNPRSITDDSASPDSSSTSSSDLSSDDLKAIDDSATNANLGDSRSIVTEDIRPPPFTNERFENVRFRTTKSPPKNSDWRNTREYIPESPLNAIIGVSTPVSSVSATTRGPAPESLITATTRGVSRPIRRGRGNKVSPVRQQDSCSLRQTQRQFLPNTDKTAPDAPLCDDDATRGLLIKTQEAFSGQSNDPLPISKGSTHQETTHPIADKCVRKADRQGPPRPRRSCLRNTASERVAARPEVSFAQYDRVRIFSTSIWLTVSGSYTGQSRVRTKNRLLTPSEKEHREEVIRYNLDKDWNAFVIEEKNAWSNWAPCSSLVVDKSYDWLMSNDPDDCGGFKTVGQKIRRKDQEQKSATGLSVTGIQAVSQADRVTVTSPDSATTRRPGKVRRVLRAVAGRLEASWRSVLRCVSCSQGME